MKSEVYDDVIIGSGEGGKDLAAHSACSGRRAAVVERRWIGGSCPNTNCLPSKNEIWSAGVAHTVSHAGSFGVTTGPISVDMAKVAARKRQMVDDLVAFHLKQYHASGAELIMGSARLIAPKTVEVTLNDGGTRVLIASRLFLNLGTQASIPAVPGLAESRPLTNVEALHLDRLPHHLIVIGGGYVGLEIGQAYRRFGSHVTIIEHEIRFGRYSTSHEVLSRSLVRTALSCCCRLKSSRSREIPGNHVRATVRTSTRRTVLRAPTFSLLQVARRTREALGSKSTESN